MALIPALGNGDGQAGPEREKGPDPAGHISIPGGGRSARRPGFCREARIFILLSDNRGCEVAIMLIIMQLVKLLDFMRTFNNQPLF
jgi:hypothetical protein